MRLRSSSWLSSLSLSSLSSLSWRSRWPVVLALVAPVVAWAAVAGGGLAGPAPAGAEVVHGQGFRAVVDGYRSWYGSYVLGEVGEVWCVDHGIRAPDAALGYEPTGLEDRAPETRRALAWAVGRWGPGADRVTAAALMLVLHDLMGAVYPSGPLSVDRLEVSALAGFEGHEGAVLERARAIKADAVGRAGAVGPLALLVEADPVPAGASSTLRAGLVDATGSGAGLGGVPVRPAVTGAELLADVVQATGDDGRVAWPFVAGAGPNHFELSATVPGIDLLALRPTLGAAQRVARPASVVVTGSASFEGEVPRALTIVKRGDAEPRLPVVGARFSVAGERLGPPGAVEVVVGADGRAGPVSLLPGVYTVTEVAPPAGYEAAGPWTVTVADADVVLEVTDLARRGSLVIEKVDALTGEAVAGASFTVAGDLDADPSTFEVPVPDGSAALLPGRYEVREVEAPPSYRLRAEPVVVEVRAGEQAVARMANVPLATVAFRKRPALAGAVFEVRTGSTDGPVAGRCETGPDGRCSLPPDVVDAGSVACWAEVVAPPGWGVAEGGCVDVVRAAGGTTEVVVDEPPLPPPAPPPAPPAPPEVEVLAAPPATVAPPPPPPPAEAAPVPPPPAGPELPRTGAAALVRWAGVGLLLVGAGVLLVGARAGPRRRA